MLRARRAYHDRLAGERVAAAWERWNAHAAAMVRTAARENPGRRILVLIGVENTGPLRATLKDDPGIRLVDVDAWLRAN